MVAQQWGWDVPKEWSCAVGRRRCQELGSTLRYPQNAEHPGVRTAKLALLRQCYPSGQSTTSSMPLGA